MGDIDPGYDAPLPGSSSEPGCGAALAAILFFDLLLYAVVKVALS